MRAVGEHVCGSLALSVIFRRRRWEFIYTFPYTDVFPSGYFVFGFLAGRLSGKIVYCCCIQSAAVRGGCGPAAAGLSRPLLPGSQLGSALCAGRSVRTPGLCPECLPTVGGSLENIEFEAICRGTLEQVAPPLPDTPSHTWTREVDSIELASFPCFSKYRSLRKKAVKEVFQLFGIDRHECVTLIQKSVLQTFC